VEDLRFEVVISAKELEKAVALAKDGSQLIRVRQLVRDYVDEAIKQRIRERLPADTLVDLIDHHLESMDWNEIVKAALESRLRGY
jgi:oligoribonuclease NrnB/cAMP/cGMP phosphodiesterase (DHH superfamily)